MARALSWCFPLRVGHPLTKPIKLQVAPPHNGVTNAPMSGVSDLEAIQFYQFARPRSGVACTSLGAMIR